MKTKPTTNRLTTAMAALVACTFGITALATTAAPLPAGPSPIGDGGGIQTNTAMVQVLHARTGKPLAGMPVFLTPVEGAGFVIRGVTGENGIATFTGVPDGVYRATVLWNNNTASAILDVGGTDSPSTATILFNPDID